MIPKCEKCQEYKKQIKNDDRYIKGLENEIGELRKKIKRQQAEIERLKSLVAHCNNTIQGYCQESLDFMVEEIEKAKSEAVKEVAQKVKELFYDGDEIHKAVDDIVKEMVGKNDVD